MPPVFVPFDGWSPGGGYYGEGWATATNLYPAYDAWRPWRKFAQVGGGVADGPMTGSYTHTWSAGVGTGAYSSDAQTIFAGSLTKLYSVNPTTGAFSNISRVAPYTANPAGWRFASVGNDIWGVNWLDSMQRRTNNTGNFADGVVSTFTPFPRFMVAIREHLVVANLSNAGRFQDEVAWSDADDATNFDPAVGTSTSIAGAKRLPSIPGQITGLVGGQYGLVFKRTGIYYLEATGTTQVFRPDVLSTHVGTALPSSIIDTRYGVFFLGPDGFYMIQGLSAPQKISTAGVDQYLLDSEFANPTSAVVPWQEDIQVVGFQMPGLPLIGWALRRKWDEYANTSAILYNPITNQWSQVQIGDLQISAVTVLGQRPYAATLYDTLAGFMWNGIAAGVGGATTYSPLSVISTNVYAPLLTMRFRPTFSDAPTVFSQSQIKGILPMFSKGAVNDPALTTSVTVEAMIDPYSGVWGTPETRTSTNRNPANGFYPFQIAGRLFRISVTCSAAEDFADFSGVWVDQDVLR